MLAFVLATTLLNESSNNFIPLLITWLDVASAPKGEEVGAGGEAAGVTGARPLEKRERVSE